MVVQYVVDSKSSERPDEQGETLLRCSDVLLGSSYSLMQNRIAEFVAYNSARPPPAPMLSIVLCDVIIYS